MQVKNFLENFYFIMFSKLTKFAPKTVSSLFVRNIAVGQRVPDASLTILEYKNGAFEKSTANAQALFATGTNILVGFPGLFSLSFHFSYPSF